ncbi:zf-HC2 domain-containing protein, partial [Clavibacter sp. MX14-G9D]|uniref:anti-sigma factor family protein n=1 Tax=Clavibacter sp. MX14-G9D TaxID=3064656 RepID=UPI00293EE9A8
MNDRADDIHEWDAAYVLGSLSATDRALFEAHLEGCDACMRSLAELSGLPGVLRMLPVEDALALMDEPDAPAATPTAPEPQGATALPAPAPVPTSHRVPLRR